MAPKEKFRLPHHGTCFICGEGSGSGLDIDFYFDGISISTSTTLDERHQGPPGHSHGGVLLAILDEAMGSSAWASGTPVLAGRVELDFKKPVPLHSPISILASVTSKEGRKVFTEGNLFLENGTIAASAKGIFIEAGAFFDKQPFPKSS